MFSCDVGINSDKEPASDASESGSVPDSLDSEDERTPHFVKPRPPLPASRHPVGQKLTANGRPRAAYGTQTAQGCKRERRAPHVALSAAHDNCETQRLLEALSRDCCSQAHLAHLSLADLREVRVHWANLGSKRGQKEWLAQFLRTCERTHRDAREGGKLKHRYIEYRLPLPDRGNPQICEKGFLIALGEGQHGFSERMLAEVRKHVLHGEELLQPVYPARRNTQSTRVLLWFARYVENLDRLGEDVDGNTVWHLHQYLLWVSLYQQFCADYSAQYGLDEQVPSKPLFLRIRRKQYFRLHRPNKGTYGRCTKCGQLWRQAEDARRRDHPEVIDM